MCGDAARHPLVGPSIRSSQNFESSWGGVRVVCGFGAFKLCLFLLLTCIPWSIKVEVVLSKKHSSHRRRTLLEME